jgi:hypothetical protein
MVPREDGTDPDTSTGSEVLGQAILQNMIKHPLAPGTPVLQRRTPDANGCGMFCDSPVESNPGSDSPEELPEPVPAPMAD